MNPKRSMDIDFFRHANVMTYMVKAGKAKPHKVDANDPLVMCYSDPRQRVVWIGPVLKTSITIKKEGK